MAKNRVSKAEAEKAREWMQTPEYRSRVEELRKRAAAGQPMTPEAIAFYLEIPLPYVQAVAAAHWGTAFRPIMPGSGSLQ